MSLENKWGQGKKLLGTKSKEGPQSSNFNSRSRFPAVVVDAQVNSGRTRAVVRVMFFQFNSGVVVTVRLALCL